jgi:hypothetical protein
VICAGITVRAAIATDSSLLTSRWLATAWSRARDAAGSMRHRWARISHWVAESVSSIARKRSVIGSSTSDPETGISAENGA